MRSAAAVGLPHASNTRQSEDRTKGPDRYRPATLKQGMAKEGEWPKLGRIRQT